MNKREELNKIVKDSIAQSIFQLMKRKRFSDITITEIVKKAGVARASFYRNFAYKEDAVSYYIIETMKLYKNQFYLSDLRDNYYNLIVGTMDFIFDYKENLESLFYSGLSQLLLHAINTYLFLLLLIKQKNIFCFLMVDLFLILYITGFRMVQKNHQKKLPLLFASKKDIFVYMSFFIRFYYLL